MRSYIVRIYRWNTASRSSLAGFIEETGTKRMEAFHDIEELLTFLNEEEINGEDFVIDRRFADRLELKLPARIYWIRPNGEKAIEETLISNISCRGTYLSAMGDFKIGDKVRLRIDPERSELERMAQIVRIENGEKRNSIGLIFTA